MEWPPPCSLSFLLKEWVAAPPSFLFYFLKGWGHGHHLLSYASSLREGAWLPPLRCCSSSLRDEGHDHLSPYFCSSSGAGWVAAPPSFYMLLLHTLGPWPPPSFLLFFLKGWGTAPSLTLLLFFFEGQGNGHPPPYCYPSLRGG